LGKVKITSFWSPKNQDDYTGMAGLRQLNAPVFPLAEMSLEW
jgi:hypothetical protein